MAGDLEQIQQDLVNLEQKVAALAGDLHQSYFSYLQVLGRVARQQLVLVCYNLTTQGYPERFLALSAKQKTELQSALRQTAQQLQVVLDKELLGAIAQYPQTQQSSESKQDPEANPEPVSESESESGQLVSIDTGEGVTFAYFFEQDDDEDGEEDEDDETEETKFEEELPNEPLSMSAAEIMAAVEMIARSEIVTDSEAVASKHPLSLDGAPTTSDRVLEGMESDLPTEAKGRHGDFEGPLVDVNAPCVSAQATPTDPRVLAEWVGTIETTIGQTLRSASREANRALQKAGILLRQLPEPVVEAAAKAEMNSEAIAGPPNLLKVLVEREDGESPKSKKSVTSVVAVYLRLSDLEFGDPELSAKRKKIRQLHSRLQTLGEAYMKKQRGRAIAQAQANWRALWFDDSQQSL